MSSVDEINWDNYKESLNRLGALCSFLIVFGTTISIYLRETVGLVIGVPDDIEVFGVPLNRQEAFLAVIVIYLVQWAVLKKLFFIEQTVGKPGCEIEKCKAFVLGRQNVFNPFARLDNRLGVLSSLISLFAFVNGVFLFPLIFTAKALTSGMVYTLILCIFYLPLFLGVIHKIYAIDKILVGQRYAAFRFLLAILSVIGVVLTIWINT